MGTPVAPALGLSSLREDVSVSRLVVNDHLADHGLNTGSVARTRQ